MTRSSPYLDWYSIANCETVDYMVAIPAGRLADLLAGALPLRRPAYRSLADGIRGILVDGRITHRTRLPSERELSRALGLSRTTVTRAYEELTASGWAQTRRGSGTTLLMQGQEHAANAPLIPSESEEGVINLTVAAPPAVAGTMDVVEQAVALLPSRLLGHGYRVTGDSLLRESIAARYDERGLPTDPGQIIVTAGALAATAVVVRSLIGPGDRAVMETPSYTNSVQTLRSGGARVIGLPVDASGWDVASFEAILRQTAPRLALLIPDFQNPTGALMDAATRDAFASVLRRTRTTGVVDETMAELWLDPEVSRMPPPFAAAHPGVITIGSTSKAFWGGFRIGWLRVPFELRDRLVEAKMSLDLGCGIVDQLIGYQLFAHRDTLLAERRRSLRASRGALVGALRERLPEWEFTTPRGGVALWARMPEPVSSAVVLAAERHGVLLAAGGQFGVDQGLQHYLRLPYTTTPDALVEGVSRIAEAYAEALAGSRVPATRPAAFVT